jgi:uncharacterized protein involved in type VI secretion and phage assembly
MSRALFGIVTDDQDPDKLGRVKVKLHDFQGEPILPWLRVVQAFASADVGILSLPSVGDHVVVLEAAGGVHGMVVLGSLYTGKRKAPALNDGASGDPLRRGIKTKGGSEITVDDTGGSEAITIRTKDGKVAVLLDAAGTKLTLTGDAEVAISSGSKVEVKAKEVFVTGDSAVTVKSSSAKIALEATEVEIKGSGSVKISGASISLE